MKKNTYILFFVLPFLGFGQSYYYDFNTDGDLEGFTHGGIPSLNVSGGVLEATDTPTPYAGGFQQIRTPDGLGLVEGDYTMVRIVAENLLTETATPGNHETFKIVNYDIGDNSPGNGEQSGNLTIPYGVGFNTYDFAIPSNSDNAGVLDRIGLRIQLGGSSGLAGTFKIDQFIIINTLSVNIATNGDFENNGGELVPWIANGPDVSASLTTGNGGGSAGRLTFNQNATTNNTLRNSFFTFSPTELEQVNDVTVNFDAKSNNATTTVGIQISHSIGGGAVNNQFNGNEALTASWASYSINRSLSADFDEIRVDLRVKTNAANASLGNTFDFDNVSVIVDYFNLAPPLPPSIASTQDGNWSDTTTWDGGVVPLGTDNVTIDHVVTVNGDVSADNLTISTGKQVLVNKGKSITVLGDLVTDSGAEDSLILRGDSDQFSSLIVNGTSTGEVRFRRYVNNNEAIAGNDLIASPVVITSFNDFYVDNASFFVEDPGSDAVLFGPFDNSANPGVYENWDFDATDALTSGKGYRMGTNGTLAETSALNFHGEVRTSDVNILTTEEVGGFGEWNLIGNPYPSYITLADFLTENNAEFAASSSGVYGYDGDASNGWTVWNQAFSDANPGSLITPGQGFFVASKVGGGSVDFTTSMRTIGSTDDFILGRNSESNHIGRFKVNLNSATSSYFTDFYFNSNASQDLDPGYDSKVFGETVSSFSIYSHLVQNNVGDAMAVQSLGANDLNNVVISLGLNAVQGEQITISLSDFDLPSSIEVVLEDALENTFTVLNTSNYTFTPNSNLSGVGRFFLRVSEDAMSLIENPLDVIQIYALNKLLVVNGIVKTNTDLNLYDIQGRLVMSKTLDSSIVNQSIDVSNATTGVYIVVLEAKGYSETKKVIIN